MAKERVRIIIIKTLRRPILSPSQPKIIPPGIDASFFSNASFSVVFPYMAELWPAKLRTSGFGLVYGCSNIAKFIGPAGLAVIAGASNYVAPQATLDALVPAFNYFAAWYLLAVVGFLFLGIEIRSNCALRRCGRGWAPESRKPRHFGTSMALARRAQP